MTTDKTSQLRDAGEFVLFVVEHPFLLTLLVVVAASWAYTLPQRLCEHGLAALNPRTAIDRYGRPPETADTEPAVDWIDEMWLEDRGGGPQ